MYFKLKQFALKKLDGSLSVINRHVLHVASHFILAHFHWHGVHARPASEYAESRLSQITTGKENDRPVG